MYVNLGRYKQEQNLDDASGRKSHHLQARVRMHADHNAGKLFQQMVMFCITFCRFGRFFDKCGFENITSQMGVDAEIHYMKHIEFPQQ